MWLVNTITNEEGWQILADNLYQEWPCQLLVFVPYGGAWKTKLWSSEHVDMRAKNHAEEIRDNYAMIQRGFKLGFTKFQLTQEYCLQCESGQGHFSRMCKITESTDSRC